MKTLVSVANALKIPPTTLKSAAKMGKFTVQKTGRDLFIDVESAEFQKWLKSYQAKAEKK